MAEAIPKTFLNQLGANLTSTGLAAVGFGFSAGFLRLIVDSGGPAYINLTSTSLLASTGASYPHSSGDPLLDLTAVGGIAGFSVASTSTALQMRYGAWG